MEMYSLPWALMVVYSLMGPLIGLLLAAVATPVAIYSFFTRKYRRHVITSRIAIGFSIVIVLLSLVMWYELLTGQLINGEPVDHSDPDSSLYQFIGVVEAIALSVSMLSMVLGTMRRRG